MALTQVSRGLLSTSIVDNGNAMAITIDSSENVGIGTSSPATALDVVGTVTADGLTVDKSGGNIAASFINSDSNNSYIQFQNSTTGTTTYTDGSLVGIDSDESLTIWQLESNHIKFGTSATERMRIDASGNLLVGSSSSSTSSGEGSKFLSNGRLFQVSSFSTNTQESLAMWSTGVSTYRFYVDWGGTVHATSTSISAISDQRLKENIRDLDAGLDEVLALKPRKFDWKEGKGANTKDARGFIAQEFEEVFPDLIDECKDPAPEGEEPYKSVRQDLIPVLVKAIQEQQETITALTARIEQLENN